MEVASPLPFVPVQAGAKRSFACSPGHSSFVEMEASEDFAHQTFKRRRFDSNENMEPPLQSTTWNSFTSCSATAAFGTPSSGRSPLHPTSGQKRARFEEHGEQYSESQVSSLKHVVSMQTAEIESLKSDKVSLESTLNEVKCAHDKAVNENRILKRAVTIQQERQNHAAQEIQGARQFKAEAEDKLRKLEQMNLTLQYHLQAQNSTGNDFMNFPRPPDVY